MLLDDLFASHSTASVSFVAISSTMSWSCKIQSQSCTRIVCCYSIRKKVMNAWLIIHTTKCIDLQNVLIRNVTIALVPKKKKKKKKKKKRTGLTTTSLHVHFMSKASHADQSSAGGRR
ncbi:unnamed protein product [Musa banksii]